MADGGGYLPPACDEQAFKAALSRWATGVAIVACRFEGRPYGVAVSSFTSVSATPPRVLFCLAKSSRSAPAFQHALEVGVAILPEGGEAAAAAFSGHAPPETRFDPAAWDLDPLRPPRLHTALANLQGLVRARMDAGSHVVVVVDVQQVVLAPGRPLLYVDRAYRRLAAD